MSEADAGHVHCVLDPGCASRRLIEAVSGRWSPLVVMALKGGGKKRHGELRRELRGVSQKMLIQTLRQLETNGLVEREVHPVVPPKVEHSLTPLGRSLQPLLEAICLWSALSSRSGVSELLRLLEFPRIPLPRTRVNKGVRAKGGPWGNQRATRERSRSCSEGRPTPPIL